MISRKDSAKEAYIRGFKDGRKYSQDFGEEDNPSWTVKYARDKFLKWYKPL